MDSFRRLALDLSALGCRKGIKMGCESSHFECGVVRSGFVWNVCAERFVGQIEMSMRGKSSSES